MIIVTLFYCCTL